MVFPVFLLVPVASCPVSVQHRDEPGSVFFNSTTSTFNSGNLCTWVRSPDLCLLQAEQSQSLIEMTLQSLIIFVSFCWTKSSTFMCPSYWAQHSKCGLHSAASKGKGHLSQPTAHALSNAA